MKKDVITTIEMTSDMIKFLQARERHKKRIVIACNIKPIHGLDEDGIVKVLAEMIRGRDVQADRLILAIPRQDMLLKQMRLPSQSEDELHKMIGLQLINQIPYELEDVIYDYVLIRKEVSGYAQVLVMILHKQVSARYLKMFEKIGLVPGRLIVSSVGVLEWLIYQQQKKKIEDRRPCIVINVDVSHMEICFTHHKRLLFSRSINYGAKDLNSNHVLGVVSQVELSIGNYQKEDMGPPIKQIFIVSTSSEVQHLKVSLEKAQDVPVTLLTPFENISCRKNLDLKSIRGLVGISLTVSLGLLFADPKRLINLTSTEVYTTKKTRMRKRQWIKMAFFVLMLGGLIGAVLGIEMHQRIEDLQILESKIKAIKPQITKNKEKTRFVEFFQEQLDNRIFVSDIIMKLYDLLPVEISFRSLTFDDKRRFTIHGYAQTSASLNDFQAQLVQSKVFQDVNLQFATKRRIMNMEVTDFKIGCQLLNFKKDKVK